MLGCHLSEVARLVKSGGLMSSYKDRVVRGGSLRRVDVLALRRARLRDELQGILRYDRTDPPRKGPPVGLGEQRWLSVRQVAQRLGVSESSIRERAKRGTIPHVRHGNRIWIAESSLDTTPRCRDARRDDD